MVVSTKTLLIDCLVFRSQANNKGTANIGQLKAVFSLRFETLATYDSDGDGLPDVWEIANGLDPTNSADAYADSDGDGITNQLENQLGTDPNSNDPIGIRNLGFGDAIAGAPEISFRPANPSDLYVQEKIPHWQSATGDYIEIWKEENGNPYVELQADRHAQGIKQTFKMLPSTKVSFLLATKGRYHLGQPADNAFDLKVEGASQVTVNDASIPLVENQRTKAFMETDTGNQWEDWTYSKITISAEGGSAVGLQTITLLLVPKEVSAPGNRITRGAFVDMLAVEVKDNTAATGVDAVSRLALGSDPGYQEDYWIMAPLQGPESFTYENLSHIRIGPMKDATGTLTTPNATPAPAQLALDGAFKDVLWQGQGNGINSEETVKLQVNGGATQYPLPVKVKTMKYREVKLRVCRVAKDLGGSQLDPDPSLVPSEAELETYLNQLFGYQLNVWFDVPPYSEIEPVNFGSIFFVNNPHSNDQKLAYDLFDQHNQYDIQVFIVGKNGYFTSPNSDETVGYASIDNNTCWVLGRPEDEYNSKTIVLATIGHEIGHILFGPGHPDSKKLESRGVAPLAGTDHTKRLMYGGKLNANSRLIVKKEWDKAEIWLKANPDEREDN